MSSAPEFTPDDWAAAERYVAKLEKDAEGWRRDRWIIVLMALFAVAVGMRYQVSFWQSVFTESEASAHLASYEPTDDDYGSRERLSVELREVAKLIELDIRGRMLGVFECVVGLGMLGSALFLSVMLYNRWSDGPQRIAVSKWARWQLDQMKAQAAASDEPDAQPPGD